MRVKFTPTARLQFLRGLAYIKRQRPSAAKRLRLRAETALRRLETHPDSGRSIPEFPELPHREVLVKPYRFFYRVDEDVVWVVGVSHAAQLPGDPPA